MNPSFMSDVSLYELALSSEHPPHPLQISPTTFKSVIGIVFDLLIEHKAPATIWLKLPRGQVWQAEIDRFRRAASAPYSLYTLYTYREDIPEAADADPLAKLTQEGFLSPEHQVGLEDVDLVDDQGLVSTLSPDQTKTLPLPLALDSQLRREYFLLVLSANFYGLVLAHRPRSVRQSKAEKAEPAMLPDSSTSPSNSKSRATQEEELDRKHPLLGLYSFDWSSIQRVLEGVHRAVCCGQSSEELSVEVQDLLINWDQVMYSEVNPSLDPLLLGDLFARQVQRQEEVWSSSAVSRRQADIATAMQLENEELHNAIRLKDEFLKNVGQELRAPLSTMKTALTLLNSPTLKPPQRQRYMDMISRECDRQSALITSVLDLLQLENVEEPVITQPLRLADVVPGVVSTYQPLAQEKGIRLAYTIPEDLPAVSCLSPWLRQIVINLLHNGIKFTPTGGQVWVKAKQQGDYIQVEFRDTGVGIPQAEIPKIFDRFYRVRHTGTEDSSGAGLGLTIVQQLLLRCGGSISVKSKPGEGAAFSILLPVYQA